MEPELPSPKLSEIPKRDSEVRNIGYAGQRTLNMLNDMGEEMAGMGMLGFQNEEDYMMRQPTAYKPNENPTRVPT